MTYSSDTRTPNPILNMAAMLRCDACKGEGKIYDVCDQGHYGSTFVCHVCLGEGYTVHNPNQLSLGLD